MTSLMTEGWILESHDDIGRLESWLWNAFPMLSRATSPWTKAGFDSVFTKTFIFGEGRGKCIAARIFGLEFTTFYISYAREAISNMPCTAHASSN